MRVIIVCEDKTFRLCLGLFSHLCTTLEAFFSSSKVGQETDLRLWWVNTADESNVASVGLEQPVRVRDAM